MQKEKHIRKAVLFALLLVFLLGLHPAEVAEGMTVHFLNLQNEKTGNCTYVRCGSTDILIDAGATVEDLPRIRLYLQSQMQDDHLDYVIVTHAHSDHYAGFATEPHLKSLLDSFSVGTILDFSQVLEESQDRMYQNYLRERQEAVARGSRHLTAKECVDAGQTNFDLGSGGSLEILDHPGYHRPSEEENNHSVCCLFRYGKESFLVTGDLEAKGEQQLILYQELPNVTLYQVGHHGSDTSTSDALLSVIRPKIAVVSCCAGSREYTDHVQNQFPTQRVLDRLQRYTEQIYVTSCFTDAANQVMPLNGTVKVQFTETGYRVVCSADPRPLFQTDWYRRYRIA